MVNEAKTDERCNHLNFPKDHYAHDDLVEWLYFWGRLSNMKYFHFVVFKLEKPLLTRAVHWSLHNGNAQYWEEFEDDFGTLKYKATYMAKNNRWSIYCRDFGLHMFPKVKPVIHKAPGNTSYYSIPSMNGEGFTYPDGKKIYSDVWMDHQFLNIRPDKFINWDWVAIKLDCGMNIMCYVAKNDMSCTVSFKNEYFYTNFILGENELFIDSLGMYLNFKPLEKETIFNPRFGVSYSEMPFDVISNGKLIGYGMRERTHHKEG